MLKVKFLAKAVQKPQQIFRQTDTPTHRHDSKHYLSTRMANVQNQR